MSLQDDISHLSFLVSRFQPMGDSSARICPWTKSLSQLQSTVHFRQGLSKSLHPILDTHRTGHLRPTYIHLLTDIKLVHWEVSHRLARIG